MKREVCAYSCDLCPLLGTHLTFWRGPAVQLVIFGISFLCVHFFAVTCFILFVVGLPSSGIVVMEGRRGSLPQVRPKLLPPSLFCCVLSPSSFFLVC